MSSESTCPHPAPRAVDFVLRRFEERGKQQITRIRQIRKVAGVRYWFGFQFNAETCWVLIQLDFNAEGGG